MLIRHAHALDAKAVGEIRVAAWKRAYKSFMPHDFLDALDPGTNLSGLRSALEAANRPFVMKVVELERTTIAFSILGKPRYPMEGSIVELWALNVHPTHWHEGIGRRLVAEALSDSRDSGYSRIELWCIAGNEPARRLYESCGFKATGESRTTSSLTGLPLDAVAYQASL